MLVLLYEAVFPERLLRLRHPLQGIRYRDGVPVAARGEKFIVEQVGEEWDGGSRGKVKTKGKRGPGMV